MIGDVETFCVDSACVAGNFDAGVEEVVGGMTVRSLDDDDACLVACWCMGREGEVGASRIALLLQLLPALLLLSLGEAERWLAVWRGERSDASVRIHEWVEISCAVGLILQYINIQRRTTESGTCLCVCVYVCVCVCVHACAGGIDSMDLDGVEGRIEGDGRHIQKSRDHPMQ